MDWHGVQDLQTGDAWEQSGGTRQPTRVGGGTESKRNGAAGSRKDFGVLSLSFLGGMVRERVEIGPSRFSWVSVRAGEGWPGRMVKGLGFSCQLQLQGESVQDSGRESRQTVSKTGGHPHLFESPRSRPGRDRNPNVAGWQPGRIALRRRRNKMQGWHHFFLLCDATVVRRFYFARQIPCARDPFWPARVVMDSWPGRPRLEEQ